MAYTVTPTPTSIPDVLILQPQVFGDARGFFWKASTPATLPRSPAWT